MATTLKQVKQIAVQLYNPERDQFGGFSSASGSSTLVDVWNLNAVWRTDWMGGSANTRSLSGFDRVGVGGYRLDMVITFRNTTNQQATVLRSLLNGIFATPAFPKIIAISPDGDIDNAVMCNVRSSAFGIRREMTIGRQAVNAQFTGAFRVNSIPDSFVIGSGA